MRVLVTGGSRGIGKAICEYYGKRGYDVVSPTRQELDLSSIDSVMEYVRKNSDKGFDIIINNAGVNDIANIDEVDVDVVENTFTINLEAPLMLLSGFVPGMKERGFGRIVNIGSIWAGVSKPGRVVYAATKNGINGITKTLAVELAPYGILVNTVSPGYTDTELTRKNNTDAQIKEISSRIPVGRMASTDEIARAVFFFGSEENRYITGQQLFVDGGYSVQ